MKQSIVRIALMVRDYDEALTFYTEKLGFEVLSDAALSEDKRWVEICPPNSRGTAIVLSKATDAQQAAFVGNQAPGRVLLFLGTDDFHRDYARMKAAGVEFESEPAVHEYGTVAVFKDLYGNLWDLIEFTEGHPMRDRI